MTACSCQCHGFGSAHNPGCDVPGGCGHLHRDESSEVTAAKFRLERKCRMPGHGQRPKEPSFGMVCHRHAADLRDLLADVHDLLIAYAEGDAINPEKSEHRGGKNPHPPIPIRLNSFLIGNPGGDPVPWDYLRNGNPVSGRLESNGSDAPDIAAVIYEWADEIALHQGRVALDWPKGDTLAKLDFIRRNLADATLLDRFDDFLTAFRNCRRALALAIGEQAGPQPLGKCPECGSPLYTDYDREVQRRRREGEPVAGEAAAPITARANRVGCHCGAVWEGSGFSRLRLILDPGRSPMSYLTSIRAGTGGRA